MSIVELAVSEGPLASAHLLALGALAFGIVPVPPARLRLARNYFLVSCAIFAGIAIMWGITTDYSTWPRVLVVGTLVGLGGVGAVESTRLIMLGQNVKDDKDKAGVPQVAKAAVEVPAPSAEAKPRFTATNNSEINAKGSAFVGTIPYPIGMADGGSKIDMGGALWIGADAPTKFPAPTGEFSRLSNSELKKKVQDTCSKLREFEERFKAETKQVPNRKNNSREEIERQYGQFREIREKYAGLYGASNFPEIATSLATEILRRTGGIEPSTVSQKAQIGAQVILQGKFVGGEPTSSSAEFLEEIVGKLSS